MNATIHMVKENNLLGWIRRSIQLQHKIIDNPVLENLEVVSHKVCIDLSGNFWIILIEYKQCIIIM
jgi:hypothetical protein